MRSTVAPKRVGVVLCSFRGTRHLGAQLDSLAAQTWPVAVTVHDDASGDGTAALASRHPVVTEVISHARNVGYVANFERGIARALADGFHHIALADQDDVWEPERVARGMALMSDTERREGVARPVLVHSDLSLVDSDGRTLHPSYLAWRGYAIADGADLPRVLGQSGVMGNTVLINRALAELALPFPPALHVHDWWLGLLAELYGCRRLERRPGVAYRLHADNASNPVGSIEPGARAILARLTCRRLLGRDFRLPFKEDSRADVLAALLADDGRRPVPDVAARRQITVFLDYLRLARPRPLLLVTLLREGFLRRGLRHRLRVALALLASDRYDGAQVRPRHRTMVDRRPTADT